MVSKILGARARFCNRSCMESFKEDRQAGLIYGSWEAPDGNGTIGWEEGSIEYEVCAYCRTDLSDRSDKDMQLPHTKAGTKRRPCPQCEILYINGVRCHEIGCPERSSDG